MRISDWSSTCALPIYTLLVLDNFDAPDIQRARAEAARVGVRLAIAPVSEPKLSSLYKSSRALVRTGQLVAWRGDDWPSTGLRSFAAGKQPSGWRRHRCDVPMAALPPHCSSCPSQSTKHTG